MVELGEDGSMVSTVKKSNGDSVIHVRTIAEDGALEVVNTLTKATLALTLFAICCSTDSVLIIEL